MSKLPKKEAHKRAKMFLTDLIELGDYLTVRDDDKIVWSDNLDGDIIIKTDKNAPAKTLYIYSIDNKDPNAILLNPINETVVMCADHQWYYQTTNKLMQSVFCQVLNAIIDVANRAKKDTEALKEPALAHLLSSFVNEVDEKMKDEMAMITTYENREKVIHISYTKKTQTCGLYTLFQDPEKTFIKSFGNKIRKKFWTLLEKVFQEIFSKEDIVSETPIYEVKKEGQYACPRFKTYTDVLTYVWKMLLPFYTLIYNEEAADRNVDRVGNAIKNIEEFDDFADVCFWANAGGGKGTVVIEDALKRPPRTSPEVPWVTEEDIKRPKKQSGPSNALEVLGINNRYGYNGLNYNREEPNIPEWKRNLANMERAESNAFNYNSYGYDTYRTRDPRYNTNVLNNGYGNNYGNSYGNNYGGYGFNNRRNLSV